MKGISLEKCQSSVVRNEKCCQENNRQEDRKEGKKHQTRLTPEIDAVSAGRGAKKALPLALRSAIASKPPTVT
jgi:hypothetical protein